MKNNSLQVWFENKRVGELWQNSLGLMGFQYDQKWIREGFPISQQLPLEKAEFSPENGKAHRFFANLLPEANARIHIVRDLKISNSDFELLSAIGGECAGALNILPENQEPKASFEYKKLSDAEFKILLLRKGQISSLPFKRNRPRLSLAGAQDKCPILFEDNHFFIPKDTAASSHILKFEISDYRNIPLYEYFLTKLAKEVALPVVDVQLQELDKQHYLLIKRYDRVVHSSRNILRLHQEDFCQALDFGHEKKYQQEGGPSFYDCYQLIQKTSIKPSLDLEHLLRWQIFNVLAGNSDGHAKNLSFLYNEHHQAELAPFYDLVCTRAIERIDSQLAMSVGGEFTPNKITLAHWKKLADECKVRANYILKLLETMAKRLRAIFAENNSKFSDELKKFPALQRVKIIILKQTSKILKEFG